jgi:hypothetical protein
LAARSGYINAGDGLSLYVWSYADGSGPMQYPGPTLIVDEGATVTVTLNNELPVRRRLSFRSNRRDDHGGVPGLLTAEASPGASVTYSFRSEPGTYHYHSGTDPDLQIEMGLLGALIVRPAASTCEPARVRTLRLRIRPRIPLSADRDGLLRSPLVEFGLPELVDTTAYHAVYWFINGRNAPDTMLDRRSPGSPTSPTTACRECIQAIAC